MGESAPDVRILPFRHDSAPSEACPPGALLRVSGRLRPAATR